MTLPHPHIKEKEVGVEEWNSGVWWFQFSDTFWEAITTNAKWYPSQVFGLIWDLIY